MANGIMDIDTQFMLDSIPIGSKAFLPTNVPFNQSYMSIASQMATPYQDFAAELGYGGDPTKIQGIGSDVRHTVGSAKGKFAVQDYLAENLAIPRDSKLSNILGDAAIVASTIGQEIPDMIKNIPEGGINFYKQPFEDIAANFRAIGLPYGTTDADLLQYAVDKSPSKGMIEKAKDLPDFPMSNIRSNRFPRNFTFPILPEPDYKYGTVKADDIVPIADNNLIRSGIINQAFERAPNAAFQQILDEEYEKGEMMENVADAPRDSLLSRILNRAQELSGGILDAAKGAGSALSNLGIVSALRNLDQFKNLSPLDQQFILQQAGGNRPMKDRFGYNIRSARGNYAQLVGNRADIARDRRARGLTLRAIDQYYLNKEKEKRALEAKAQRDFLASENRGGDGPQNNPQGGLGRQDYSRAPSADFAALADELGIEY